MTNSNPKDLPRALSNLILAPAMMILSNVPMVTDLGRSPSEFSDQNDSLLVPFGIAFSIWLPIFIFAIIYGVVQFLPANRTRDVFRKTGWWTAAGFGFVCLWSLISGFAPEAIVLWGTALTFVPMVFCLVTAMLGVTQRKDQLSKGEKWTVWVPVSLIAGWTSIAMFLNFTPITTGILGGFGISETLTAIVMLSAALIFAVTIETRSGGNAIYAFPILWGLAWLAYARFHVDDINMNIGYAALIGFAILLSVTLYTDLKKRRSKL